MFFTKDLILAQEYLAFVLLNLADLFATGYIFRHNGMEANGIAAWVLHEFGQHGLLAFAIYKFLLVMVLVIICEVIATYKLKSARMVILLGCAVYGFVVIYESVLIFQNIDRPQPAREAAAAGASRPEKALQPAAYGFAAASGDPIRTVGHSG